MHAEPASLDPDAFPAHEVELLTQISTRWRLRWRTRWRIRNRRSHDHLAEEKEYLEAEIRLEHDFGGIIGESSSLKAVLRDVETVAPTTRRS